jgi:hypothetical protein
LAVKVLTAQDVVGHVVALARDQDGCRQLQLLLEAEAAAGAWATPAVPGEDGEQASSLLDLVFAEVLPALTLLMPDPFGNYLCQKVFDYCGPTRRVQAITALGPAAADVAADMCGTRALQRLIDACETPEECDAFAAALDGHVVALITNNNGNHAIQRMLQKFREPRHLDFIMDTVAAECSAVACHQHGCCVFQRCLDVASAPQLRLLAGAVARNVNRLVQDSYANYVVSYCLELYPKRLAEGTLGPDDDRAFSPDDIIRPLLPSAAVLSLQKFSSHVIENALAATSRDFRAELISAIAFAPDFSSVVRSPFGNYTAQKLLRISRAEFPALFGQISSLVLAMGPALASNPYARRVIEAAKPRPTRPADKDKDGPPTRGRSRDQRGMR